MKDHNLLEMKNIRKEFPGVLALNNVEFSLNGGEIRALLGENGAGKSTLIKVLTGVEPMDEGSIIFNNQSIHPKSVLETLKLGISSVYQEVNLCPNLSVAENIYIGREPTKKSGRIDWNKMYEDTKILLKKFGIDIDVKKKLDRYSIAIQQMVAIARAIDIKADILILDEPTSSLTIVETKKLFETMRMLKEEGVAIIFVTHFLEQVYEVADSITVLRNGEYVGTYQTSELPHVELVGKMIGKDYSELGSVTHAEITNDEQREILVEAQDVSTGYISNVDLKIAKGEVLGFSGLLGSGRSEIARLLFGADKNISGDISVNGKKSQINTCLDAIKNGFALCPEDRKLEGIIGDLSVKENVILALQAKRGLFKPINHKEVENITQEYTKKFAIKTSSSEQLIKNLSGGNQQKVILARWMASNPVLLMLDEPTRGIDIGAKIEIQKIVVETAKKGMSVVFISSEIDEILRCSSRILVLKDKKEVAELVNNNINEHTIMKYIAGVSNDS